MVKKKPAAKPKKAAPSNEKRYEPDREWFQTRLDEQGISPRMAAAAFGLEDSQSWMIRRMLAGERALRPDEIAIWAKLVRASPTTVLRKLNLGVDIEEPRVPVVGIVRDDGRVSSLPESPPQMVEAPTDAPGGMVALNVEAPLSGLAYFHGSTFYFVPSDKVMPDSFGRLSVIEIGDSPSPVVGVLDRASVGRGRVVIFGTNESIETKMMVSATPIRWIRAG